MSTNKITPFIWFSAEGGSMQPIVTYYQNIFGAAFKPGTIATLTSAPGSKTETCEVELFGQKYGLLCTAALHQPLTDALSFMLHCEDQTEIDTYWNYFTKEGKESRCGWCIDKYGLRWQVLPKNFKELLQKPNAFTVMMGQVKIVIAEY